MRDRTVENQVYVRQQKAAEEQLRFDKTEKPSCLASKVTAAVYHSAPHVMGAAGRLLVVVYTWRSENIRIISARPAEAHEREDYEGER